MFWSKNKYMPSVSTTNIYKLKKYSKLKLPVINKIICNGGCSVYHHRNLNESFDISLQGTLYLSYFCPLQYDPYNTMY